MSQLNMSPDNNSIDFEPGLKPEDVVVESPAEHAKRMEELSKRFDLPKIEEAKPEPLKEGPKKLISSYDAAMIRRGLEVDSEVGELENNNQENQRIDDLAREYRTRVIKGLNEDYKKILSINKETLNDGYYNTEEHKVKYAKFIEELKKEIIEKTYHVIFFDELLDMGDLDRDFTMLKAKEMLGEDFNETQFSEIFERINSIYVTKDPKQDGSFKMLMEQGAFDISTNAVENITSGVGEYIQEGGAGETIVDSGLSLGGKEQQTLLPEDINPERGVSDEIKNIGSDQVEGSLEAGIKLENEKKKSLDNLYQQGLLKKFGFGDGDPSEKGNDLICEIAGRKIVLADVLGTLIPFYCSAHGTDGKNKGKWYPFFGFKYDGWFIKGYGGLNLMNKGYGSKEIKNIMDTLDSSLGDINIPTYNDLAKKADEDHPLYDYINGLIKTPTAGEQIDIKDKYMYQKLMRGVIEKVINKENEIKSEQV